MKTQAHVVLGAGFGDEGKGVTTDYLCSKGRKPIAIRFSGGQQAGHTVMIGDKKHIHSNYGSGTLRGAPSYFTEHCTFFLNTIANEQDVLFKKGKVPSLHIHPLAKMTTPYDVAFGRMREKFNNHGSVGLGVGATMMREKDGYKLHAVDLFNWRFLFAKLEQLKAYYRKKVAEFPPHALGQAQEFYEGFLEQWEMPFLKHVMNNTWKHFIQIADYKYLQYFTDLIFEGSQGILLDMDHGIFPHVTYASTTSRNALEVCQKLGVHPQIWYVTRCYQTRHGHGWMSDNSKIELINTHQEINLYNEWQTEFRIGEFDYDLLCQAIQIDRIYSAGEYVRNLVITCLDQRPNFKFDARRIPTSLDIGFLYGNDSPQTNIESLHRKTLKKHESLS